MEKPLSIRIVEVKNEIANILNNSKLNATILEPVVKEIHEELIKVKIEEYQRDKEAWSKEENARTLDDLNEKRNTNSPVDSDKDWKEKKVYSEDWK